MSEHVETRDSNNRAVCGGCGKAWPCPPAAQAHAFIYLPTTKRWERLCEHD